jgi:predicted HAD superfamily phosphohydrolase YqeG
VPKHVVRGLDHVEELTRIAAASVVIIFDADNTLVPQGVDLEAFQRGVNATIERFRTYPHVDRVIVLTNGPERGVPGMIPRANKPWTSRSRLGVAKGHEALWVVGDQVLTDGVLAWRLGATFVHLVLETQGEGRRQTIMRRLGRLVERLLFRPAAV